MALPIQSPERYALTLERPKLDPPKLERPPLEAPTLQNTSLGQSPSVDFAEQVKNFVGDVNGLQKQAELKSTEFANGKSNDIHGTMIAMQQADISLRLLGNVRNRVIELYREVMRMGT